MTVKHLLPIKSIEATVALEALRIEADMVLKAGILPFFRETDGSLRFLIAKPRPQRNAADDVPFAIARGTRQVEFCGEGGESFMLDISNDPARNKSFRATYPDVDVLQYAHEHPEAVEPLWQTALLEAEEELGLKVDNIVALYDAGILKYKDYAVQFHVADVRDKRKLVLAKDSVRVEWVSAAQVFSMAKEGVFNTRYVPIFEALVGVCES